MFGRLFDSLFLGLAVFLGAPLLVLGGLASLLFLTLARFLCETQALFLGLALETRDALLRGFSGRSRLLRRSLLPLALAGRDGERNYVYNYTNYISF